MSAEALLLEIDPLAATRMTETLQGAGYWITRATTLSQALAKLQAPDAAFDVLVADLSEAPTTSARRLLRAARRRFPRITIVCAGDGAALPPRMGRLITCDYSTEALMDVLLALRAARQGVQGPQDPAMPRVA